MTLRLAGSTSGYTEIEAPAVAGSNTLVLPTGNGSADQALVTNGSGTLSFADRGRMTLATAQNSTSGTSIDFTGIPSWVKRVTVMFNGVSTNGTSNLQLQLGTSSGVVSSGYVGQVTEISTASSTNGVSNATSGVYLSSDKGAADLYYAVVSVTNISSNTWLATGVGKDTSWQINVFGTVALASTLDRIRITTVNGTDTFDAGSINILLEG